MNNKTALAKTKMLKPQTKKRVCMAVSAGLRRRVSFNGINLSISLWNLFDRAETQDTHRAGARLEYPF